MRFLIKFVAIVASIYGIIRLGITPMNFTYFTILSNIAISLILLVFLILDIKTALGKTKDYKKSNTLYIIKFMLTISITLTCLVYMFLLGPHFEGGLIASYLGDGAASLCVHLITPVLAIIDFFVYDYDYKSTKAHAFFATVPALCYVCYVLIAGQFFHVRWMDNMIAPYNFLNYDAPCGWFGFNFSHIGTDTLGIGVAYMIVALLIIFTGIGLLYLAIKNLRYKAVYKSA